MISWFTASKKNQNEKNEIYILTLNRGHLDFASTPINMSGALNSLRNKATSYKQTTIINLDAEYSSSNPVTTATIKKFNSIYTSFQIQAKII